MCEIMDELKKVENRARKDCNASDVFELQAVHGQTSLSAQQMQTFHAKLCSECIDEAHSESSMEETR
jgi:signal recognition particle GTPase